MNRKESNIFEFNEYRNKSENWIPTEGEIKNVDILIEQSVNFLNKIHFEICEEGNIRRKMFFDSDKLLKPTKFKINGMNPKCIRNYYDLHYKWILIPDRYKDDMFVVIRSIDDVNGSRNFVVFRMLDKESDSFEYLNGSTSKKISFSNCDFYVTVLPYFQQTWGWDFRNVGSYFLIDHVFGSWVSHRDAAGSEINTIDLDKKELKNFNYIAGPGNRLRCGVHNGQWLFFDVYYRNTEEQIKYAGIDIISTVRGHNSNSPKIKWCLLQEWKDHLCFNKFQIYC